MFIDVNKFFLQTQANFIKRKKNTIGFSFFLTKSPVEAACGPV